MRPVHAIAGLLLASLAVGISVLAVGWTPSDPPDDLEEHLALLIETLGEHRPLEARLVGFDHWAPCETPAVGPIQPDTLLPEDVLPRTVCSTLPETGTAEFEALWALEPPSDAPESVALLRLQAIWDLVWRTKGDSDDAVKNLRRAIELAKDLETEEPGHLAGLWNDLGAAYLARAEDEEQPLDLLRALDAADRALEISPDMPEALFNKALAFGRFHQRQSARQAWNEFLTIEPGSPFAHEAREHLEALSELTLYEAWHGGGKTDLEHAAFVEDRDTVSRLVTRYLSFARIWIEEDVLPAWGDSELSGERQDALQALAVARTVGRELSRQLGDSMIVDSMAAMDAATPTTRARLARGEKALGVGFAAFRRQDQSDVSREALLEAERELTASGSPRALWARYHLLVQEFYTDTTGSYSSFRALRSETETLNYPVLSRQLEWMLGLASWQLDLDLTAQRHFRRGILAVSEVDDLESATLLSYLGSVRSQDTGRGPTVEELWALAGLTRWGDPHRLHNVHHTLGFFVEDVAEPRLGLYLANSTTSWADSWGLPIPRADARINLSTLQLEAGAPGAALSLLDFADEILAGQGDSAIVAQTNANIALARSRALRELGELSGAVDTLSTALEHYLVTQHTDVIAELLEERSELLRELGDPVGAADDLEQGIAQLEDSLSRDMSGSLPDLARQDLLGRLGHQLAWSQANDGRDVDALGILERTRPPWWGPRRPERYPALLAELPQERIVLVTATFPDRLGLWIFSPLDEQPRWVDQAIDTDTLDSLLADLKGILEDPESTDLDWRRATAPLYRLLIVPALARHPSATELVIVPDGDLTDLPYLGLFDIDRGEYLLDQIDVSLATSLRAAFAGSTNPPGSNPIAALAVAGDGFDQSLYSELDRLGAAFTEIDRIGALYPGGVTLTGPTATLRAIADAVPRETPGVLHLAGHLLQSGDPRFPHFLVAPAAGSPSHLPLSTLGVESLELLFLSACRGGSFSTLGWVLAAHGVPMGIGNLRDVDDRIAARVGESFHRHYLETRNAPSSLRRAIAELRAQNPTVPAKEWSGWIALQN